MTAIMNCAIAFRFIWKDYLRPRPSSLDYARAPWRSQWASVITGNAGIFPPEWKLKALCILLIRRGGEYEKHSFGIALSFPVISGLHRRRRLILEPYPRRGRREESAHRGRGRDMERAGGVH